MTDVVFGADDQSAPSNLLTSFAEPAMPMRLFVQEATFPETLGIALHQLLLLLKNPPRVTLNPLTWPLFFPTNAHAAWEKMVRQQLTESLYLHHAEVQAKVVCNKHWMNWLTKAICAIHAHVQSLEPEQLRVDVLLPDSILKPDLLVYSGRFKGWVVVELKLSTDEDYINMAVVDKLPLYVAGVEKLVGEHPIAAVVMRFNRKIAPTHVEFHYRTD